MSNRLLNTIEFAERVNATPYTVRKWQRQGQGPVVVRPGGERGHARYRNSDVEAWIESRARRPEEDAVSEARVKSAADRLLARQREDVVQFRKRYSGRPLSEQEIEERVRRFDAFQKEFGVTERRKWLTPPFCVLLPKRCRMRQNLCDHCLSEVPAGLHARNWQDHAKLFNAGGRPAVWTSQPYDLTAADRQILSAYIESLGLKVSFRDDLSWWLPGRTTLVIVQPLSPAPPREGEE